DRRDADPEAQRAARPRHDRREGEREQDEAEVRTSLREETAEKDVPDADPREGRESIREDDDRADRRGDHRTPEHVLGEGRRESATGLVERENADRGRVESGGEEPCRLPRPAHCADFPPGSTPRKSRVYPTGSPDQRGSGIVPSRCRSIACSSHAKRFGQTGHSDALFSGSRPRLVRTNPHRWKKSGTRVSAKTRRRPSRRASEMQASTSCRPIPRPDASGRTASERTSARSGVRTASAQHPRNPDTSLATRKSRRCSRRKSRDRSSMRSSAAYRLMSARISSTSSTRAARIATLTFEAPPLLPRAPRERGRVRCRPARRAKRASV